MLNKEDFIEKNKAQIALDYFNTYADSIAPISIIQFTDNCYANYVNSEKKKNARPGQTLAEAFGFEPSNIRIDDIPMKTVSRDYVTLEKMIEVNNKLISVQFRFNYKDLL